MNNEDNDSPQSGDEPPPLHAVGATVTDPEPATAASEDVSPPPIEDVNEDVIAGVHEVMQEVHVEQEPAVDDNVVMQDEEEDEEETKVEATAQQSEEVAVAAKQELAVEEEVEVPVIWEPNDADVLSGRGASVNAHGGNKKFRALCFARKPEFEAGNHAAKRRIATEIVAAISNGGTARFLKRKSDKEPWYEMTTEQSILKSCQVMRDYKRPDRIAIREMMAQNGNARKRNRQTESTPMLDTPVPTGPLEPIIENPFGVHDHDILSGRGAFVNGHIGNQRLRTLAMERKMQFDGGNYTEKRALATEIVQIIKSLDPPGRFLRRKARTKASENTTGENQWNLPPRGLDGSWELLNDEKSIHKACQVMRDIDRPDRKDRELRRAKKKQKVVVPAGTSIATKPQEVEQDSGMEMEKGEVDDHEDDKDSMAVLAETTAEKAAVDEAVAATEEALDKALCAVPDKVKPVTMDIAETAIV